MGVIGFLVSHIPFSEYPFLHEFRKNVTAMKWKQTAVGMDSLAKELSLYSTGICKMYPEIARTEISKIITDRISFTNFNFKSF